MTDAYHQHLKNDSLAKECDRLARELDYFKAELVAAKEETRKARKELLDQLINKCKNGNQWITLQELYIIRSEL